MGHCSRAYLCCGEEDVIRYVAHSTGYNSQSDSREDISVVSLPGVEGTSISQRHLVERTSTSKDAPALITGREMMLRKDPFFTQLKHSKNHCYDLLLSDF